MDNNPQKMVTRYALILFGLLSITIIYTYFSSLSLISSNTIDGALAFKPSSNMTVQTVSFEENTTPNIITPSFSTSSQSVTMKSDDYKIPVKRQKLTELLPEELKRNIKASLLTAEQLKDLSPEERFKYKQTQKKLAKVLREIGKTEAENQKLHGYLSQAEDQKTP